MFSKNSTVIKFKIDHATWSHSLLSTYQLRGLNEKVSGYGLLKVVKLISRRFLYAAVTTVVGVPKQPHGSGKQTQSAAFFTNSWGGFVICGSLATTVSEGQRSQ